MRIQYRVREDEIEVVRCFGMDGEISLPGQIEGLPVRKVAPYAFSARKEKEDGDVHTFVTEETFFHGDEVLLAGLAVQSVKFPDTLEQIGNYIFYGCKNLRRLEFSNRLLQIGSGAFTGCSGLVSLRVSMLDGEKTCVKEILGDLWQRIDVAFSYADGHTARFVFPEHYEEAVENTPARILFTQHHGSGNNYRQCFYNKELDCRKYDELFAVARAHDDIEVLSDLIFARLCSPVELTEKARLAYEGFVREKQEEILAFLVKTEKLEALETMAERKLWTRQGIEAGIEAAAKGQRAEVLSFLMNEKHKNFAGEKKKFIL